MFKKMKNFSNMSCILLLVSVIIFCSIYASNNKLYVEGMTDSKSDGLKDNIYHSGAVHAPPAPAPAPEPAPAPAPAPPPVQAPPPPPPAVYPTCKPYQGTVWAFCGDKPTHRWGIGPEGQKKAIGNCNYAARNQKRWGACK